MSTANESVVVLSRALDQTGDVLAAVHEDQLSLPTPCDEWDVRRLLAHVVNDPRTFLAMGRGNQIDWSSEPPPVTPGWAAEFRSAADDLIHFWHEAGESAAPVTVPDDAPAYDRLAAFAGRDPR